MKILRTPERCFTNLKGYPFDSNYFELQHQMNSKLRLHYLDEGDSADEVILMLHGEPSWSYLYRNVIPVCTAAGFRVIAPDLIGFGKSDKPSSQSDYSYQTHVDWILELIEALNLHKITLVCQDWGALIGLRIAAEHEQRFARIVVSNGMLPTGDLPLSDDFIKWREFAADSTNLNIGEIIQKGCLKSLDEETLRAYNAPFPTEIYKAGAKIFPSLVPSDPSDPASPANRKAWKILKKWKKPFLTAFSDSDPITKGGDLYLRKHIPGSRDQNHRTIVGGHFSQEDSGEELGRIIVNFIESNSFIY